MLHWHHTLIGIIAGAIIGYVIGVHVSTVV